MDKTLSDEIADLLSSGEKIAAIKHYRETTGASLMEAKRAVEDIGAGRSIDIAEADLSDLASEILELLDQNRKIEAIKLYRERTGTGLKEAKDVVEQIAEKAGLTGGSSGSGCAGVVLAAVAGLAGTAAALVGMTQLIG